MGVCRDCCWETVVTHSCHTCSRPYQSSQSLQMQSRGQSHQFLSYLGAPWPSGTSSSSGISILLLPPVMAPLKCSVLPLSGNVEFQPFVCQLCVQSS
ncbi:uncharacterized protein LOC134542441 isoform X2 [Bacillus rossius redtenbacheri]